MDQWGLETSRPTIINSFILKPYPLHRSGHEGESLTSSWMAVLVWVESESETVDELVNLSFLKAGKEIF